MTSPPSPHPLPLLVCGDFADPRCGVGTGEATCRAASGLPLPVLDPLASPRAILRAVAEARRAGRHAVIAFPTRSTITSLRAYAAFAIITLGLRRRRNGVRWHLHELTVFTKIRWVLGILALLGSRRTVVSTERERRTYQSIFRGLVARRVPLVVAPPVNATGAPAVAGLEVRQHVVGIFGYHRPGDKDPDWVERTLLGLPPELTRLELAGSGWDRAEWPAALRARFEIVPLGHVADADLPAVIGSWGLAIAAFAEGASDSRMSLRTPLHHGVPTLSQLKDEALLTFRPPHLVLADEGDTISSDALRAARALDRAESADLVARFEVEVRARMAHLLYGPLP